MKLQGRDNAITGKVDVYVQDQEGGERFLASFDTLVEAREYAVSFRNGVQTLAMMREQAPDGDFAAGYRTPSTIVVHESPEEVP